MMKPVMKTAMLIALLALTIPVWAAGDSLVREPSSSSTRTLRQWSR